MIIDTGKAEYGCHICQKYYIIFMTNMATIFSFASNQNCNKK